MLDVHVSELVEHHKELMIPYWRVKRRVAEMAREYVVEQSGDGEDALFLTILCGGASFAEMFLTEVAKLGYGEYSSKDNIGLSSYSNGDSSNRQPEIIQPLKNPEAVAGRKVVILEDIKDTGISLEKVISELTKLGATSIEVIALLAKPEAAEVQLSVPSRYGFEIPKEFVVGDGIDWAEKYRVLLGVWRIVKHENGVKGDERNWGQRMWERVNVWVDRHLT